MRWDAQPVAHKLTLTLTRPGYQGLRQAAVPDGSGGAGQRTAGRPGLWQKRFELQPETLEVDGRHRFRHA